ncbi:retrovirus-related pol polyprotein from transposon TNT 1-94 [Tanacetum coccineum]
MIGFAKLPSRNIKNKVEAQPRKVNKKNHVVEPICDVDVKHSLLNANSKLICATCNKSMFDDIHDICLLDFVKNVNGRSKFAKKHKNKIFGNLRVMINHTKVVPIKESTPSYVKTSKPNLKVYSRRPKNVSNRGSSKKAKIVKSKNANNSEPNHTWGSNAIEIPLSSSLVNDRFSRLSSGTVRFGNDQIARIMGYGDYQMGMLLSQGYTTYLRTKDEAPEAIIKCIKNIQVRLNATVRNVQTDNETEFVNQTLCDFYENVGISHQTFIGRIPQQNDIFERRNQTLVEAARIMLIFSKDALFLWAEAINTACYTQNRSFIRLRYNKTPYELMQEKKPDLSFLHVFGSLCYPTNDNEDLGKLDAKADIGPGVHSMTPATSSSGLVSNPVSQQPFIPPNRDAWDRLFQPMFDEYFNPPTIVVSPVLKDAAPRAVVLADSPVLTSIDQDAPSASIPSTHEQEHSPNISQGFKESPKIPFFHDNPLHESLHEDSTSQGSSSNLR